MARGQSWVAKGYDYASRTRFADRPQTAGVGCIRVLNCMADCLRGGIVSPTDPDEGAAPTRAMAAGTYAGAAMWDAEILRTDANAVYSADALPVREEWVTSVAQSGVVPRGKNIQDALRVWFGCGGNAAEPACDDTRCPDCWLEGDKMGVHISCSRFKHGAPPRASSGQGRWKGGDVQTATLEGVTPRAWALGGGMGEDVEIYTHREAKYKSTSGDGNVTLGKILYFFDESFDPDKACSTNSTGAVVEWVLVYEYVTCGAGRAELKDSITQHPTYWLQGNAALPSVFPVSSIRRHVHMSHLCPLSTLPCTTGRSGSQAATSGVDAEWVCGLSLEDKARGGRKVWKHKYKLAAKAGAIVTRDRYLLNEHWHSAFQDGVM